jgi:hypothetical protein
MALALASGAAGCDPFGDDASTPGPAGTTLPIRNGSTQSQRMKGVAEILSLSDGRRCSGVILQRDAIMTTTSCITRLLHHGERSEDTTAIQINTYSLDASRSFFVKHCTSNPEVPCDTTLDEAKPGTVHRYSLSTSMDSDLAIFRVATYPAYISDEDFADLYVDDVSPTATPRLQVYGWGTTGSSGAPTSVPLTGSMQVMASTAGHVQLKGDQIQACTGDEGSPVTILNGNTGSANAVVALQSRFVPDGSGCAPANAAVYATRISDKMAWIDSIAGPCGAFVDFAGHNIRRCGFTVNCDGSTAETGTWQGCRGSGCAVCSEVTAAYPKYFDHHRNCSRNTTCGGQFFTCSDACPPPTESDR